METPRQQGSIFIVPQEQDKPNALCLVNDSKKEALLGTPRQYRELLLKIPDQDSTSPYRLMATAALAQDYAKVCL